MGVVVTACMAACSTTQRTCHVPLHSNPCACLEWRLMYGSQGAGCEACGLASQALTCSAYAACKLSIQVVLPAWIDAMPSSVSACTPVVYTWHFVCSLSPCFSSFVRPCQRLVSTYLAASTNQSLMKLTTNSLYTSTKDTSTFFLHFSGCSVALAHTTDILLVL